MGNIKRKIKFNRFLFVNIIFIVLLVYGYYIISSIILDYLGNQIFSTVAYRYSADYIFEDSEIDSDKLVHIKEIGGWVFVIDNNFNLEYNSSNAPEKEYNFRDLISLNKGTYEYNKEKYFGSVKILHADVNDKYGIVVVPSKYINNQILVMPQKQDLGFFIIFFITKIFIFVFGILMIVFLFSKLLYKELYKPLMELEYGFKQLRDEKYPVISEFNRKINIIEFTYIRDSFNSMVQSLKELKIERINNKDRRLQLFADIRHDLKTPITIIKGFSEALISKKISEKDSIRYLKSINKNANIIDSLLNQMSEIIEYEDYKYDLKLEKFDFCEYVRQTIIEFLPVFEQNGIEIEIEIPEEKFFTEIDKNIFNRAIKNLMQNIVDHNPTGIKVYFEIKRYNGKILLIIGDTGNKIPNNIAEDIFNPFVTSDSSRNMSNKNRGLGLTIAKKIIMLHGGRIYLSNEKFKNYTKYFTIELQEVRDI